METEIVDIFPVVRREEVELLGVKIAVTVVDWYAATLISGPCWALLRYDRITTDRFVEAEF